MTRRDAILTGSTPVVISEHRSLDRFADDDPAVMLGRAALRQGQPPTPPPVSVVPASPPDPEERSRIAELRDRVRAGDRSAISLLRSLLR